VETNELLWEFFMQHPMPLLPTRLGRKPGARAALGAEAAARTVAAGALRGWAGGVLPPAPSWTRATRGCALVGVVALLVLGLGTRALVRRPRMAGRALAPPAADSNRPDG
jgi:hypothetical protein